eukprot:gnl/TRDRNA2_/TRDRNA2_167913_c0_seq11.p1 gnl/TRDRNA2_/TRDRNA2_167913_c0~~gnl/TRDRNA2_/TRDRNA2_167913_c0_seq11.p1  ORF type:complete len:283 (+),score=31.98 gnl/TRDRNA2_/TRDRNA2_167913_c0_seq11:86-934(+)
MGNVQPGNCRTCQFKGKAREIKGDNADTDNSDDLTGETFFICSDGRLLFAKRDVEQTSLLTADSTSGLCIKNMVLIPPELHSHAMSCRLKMTVKDPGYCSGSHICYHVEERCPVRPVAIEPLTTECDANGITSHVKDTDAAGYYEYCSDLTLSSLSTHVHMMFFAVDAISDDLNDIDGIVGQLVDLNTEKVVCSFEKLSGFSANVIILAMFIRDGPDWYFIALDEMFNVASGDNDMESEEQLSKNVSKLACEEALHSIYQYGRADRRRTLRLSSPEGTMIVQ